ncbi:YopX family protein [Lactiplantibacillus mudanjiangensis]|uniref:Hypothetical phage protein [Lactobacillus casei subsp. casei ATCC 393] n=1 Tax=Lactiplantibacillus mudanjiangensis TaxID=1296538 RepID=A0A660E2M6_9LACO|nr:YopX family protein [Lactiplantibacillus mudanjiangensis]VDG25832.1 hypothetical phage protein [Lactobacillus casei subsp. casei ATCC 393] [Lactiplantibacillus mudanjiangensis]VDG28887.1 hypothetical phage protein [Lactobacillus casei subsp. casei ATCC 393] [Lactiplantibacillus mudanjiangensis]
MSEIEFRAWHKPTKTMHRVLAIDWLNQMVDLDGGLIEQSSDDVVVEQYTGKDDKSGKPIYEGSIFGFDNIWLNNDVSDPQEEHYVGVVKRDPNTGMWFVDCTKHKFYLGDAVESDSYGVIGNIHENPELLEAAK